MNPSPQPTKPPVRRSLAARAAAAVRRIGLLAAALLLLAAGGAPPPSAVIERLYAALLQSMQNADTLGFSGRYENLAPVLTEGFDLAFMARAAAGRDRA